jgi:hypothetical protein
MRRVIARIALVALAAPALGGCAVSLFSDTSKGGDEERISRLETRMDAAEKASGVR